MKTFGIFFLDEIGFQHLKTVDAETKEEAVSKFFKRRKRTAVIVSIIEKTW